MLWRKGEKLPKEHQGLVLGSTGKPNEVTALVDCDDIHCLMIGASLKCTRIVIAHRLSTVRHCDRILVLDGGKIAEAGTYEALIAKGGIFAELVERQRI